MIVAEFSSISNNVKTSSIFSMVSKSMIGQVLQMDLTGFFLKKTFRMT